MKRIALIVAVLMLFSACSANNDTTSNEVTAEGTSEPRATSEINVLDKAFEYMAFGETEKALVAFEEGYKKAKDDVEKIDILNYIAKLKLQLGKLEEAHKAVDEAIALDPKVSRSYLTKTNICLAQQNVQEALKIAEEGLKAAPDSVDVYTNMATVQIVNSKPDKAAEYLEKAVTMDPKSGMAWGYYAFAEAMRKNFDKADEFIQKAESLGYVNTNRIKLKIEELKKRK